MGLELIEFHFFDTFPQVVTTTSILSELSSYSQLGSTVVTSSRMFLGETIGSQDTSE